MTMVERAVAAALKRGGSLEDQHEAALLAALDAEDEALVEAVMRGIQQGAERNGAAPYDALAGSRHALDALRDEAIEAIKALRSLAQGA